MINSFHLATGQDHLESWLKKKFNYFSSTWVNQTKGGKRLSCHHALQSYDL